MSRTTAKARSRSGIDCKSKLMGTGECRRGRQFVMKTVLEHCEYDRKIELLSILLVHQRLEEGRKDQSPSEKCMMQLVAFHIDRQSIFCENKLSVQLLFEHCEGDTLHEQIKSKEEFSVREVMELAKFLLNCSEEALADTDGGLLKLFFHIDHIFLVSGQYKCKNLIQTTFLQPPCMLPAVVQSPGSRTETEGSVFDAMTVFSIGLTLLSCWLLEDCFEECIVKSTGQICRSVVEAKIESMRDAHESIAGQAVCDFIEMLLLWPSEECSAAMSSDEGEWRMRNEKEKNRDWLVVIKRTWAGIIDKLRDQ